MNGRNREEGGMNAPGPEKKVIHTSRIFRYSCVSNKRAVSNKHPGLNFALKKISVLYLINVLA